MAFPTVDWDAVEAAFDSMIEANGQDVDVVLRDGITTFSLKGVMRKAPVQNMTDGLQQEQDRLSVMRDRWDAGAGRDPEKGDQVTLNGRRQAVQSVNAVGAGNRLIGFNLVLLG